MQRVLLTGAAGGVGRRLRRLLPPVYPELRLTDIATPPDLGPDEVFGRAPDPVGDFFQGGRSARTSSTGQRIMSGRLGQTPAQAGGRPNIAAARLLGLASARPNLQIADPARARAA
jgi:hypothetical protein